MMYFFIIIQIYCEGTIFSYSVENTLVMTKETWALKPEKVGTVRFKHATSGFLDRRSI